MVSFDRPIPGIDSTADFYRQLLAQYAAVSYGDDLYGLAILLPTAGRNSSVLKDVLWIDNQESLRLIRLESEHLPAGLTVDNFLDHPATEASEDRIRAYAGAIVSGRLDAARNPLMFAIARANVLWARRSDNPQLVEALRPFEANICSWEK